MIELSQKKKTGIDLFTLYNTYIWHDHLKVISLQFITLYESDKTTKPVSLLFFCMKHINYNSADSNGGRQTKRTSHTSNNKHTDEQGNGERN